jgi:hypothetical protein
MRVKKRASGRSSFFVDGLSLLFTAGARFGSVLKYEINQIDCVADIYVSVAIGVARFIWIRCRAVVESICHKIDNIADVYMSVSVGVAAGIDH